MYKDTKKQSKVLNKRTKKTFYQKALLCNRGMGLNSTNFRDELTSFINKLPAHNEPDSLTIQPATQNEVSKIVQNIRSASFTGHDSIPIKFLKFVADDISLP